MACLSHNTSAAVARVSRLHSGRWHVYPEEEDNAKGINKSQLSQIACVKCSAQTPSQQGRSDVYSLNFTQENKIFRVLERTADINAEEIRIIEHKYVMFRNTIERFLTVFLEIYTSDFFNSTISWLGHSVA